MILNAHAGTKYGVSFPVLCRASFGVKGANIPAMLRAIVACGWFGIQTWIGGLALDALMTALWPAWASLAGGKAIAFLVFWLIQVAIIIKGTEGIKILESWSAPLLLVGGLALLIWAIRNGGGLGNILSRVDANCSSGSTPFWTLFPAALTANVGYWATLSLNIPDFTRYAKSQRSQVTGQALGLPTTMTAFAFIGVAVTSATIVVFGKAIWDPIELIAMIGSPAVIIFGALVVLAAQITTNMAANVVSPANDFSNLSSAEDLVRHRRPDHRRHRHRDDAVEALLRRGRVHLHVAHRLLEPDGRARRNPHRRLLGRAQAEAQPARPVRAAGRVHLLERHELARGRGAGAVDPAGRARLHPRGDDAGRPGCRIPNFFDHLYTYAWFVTFILSFVLYLVFMKRKA